VWGEQDTWIPTDLAHRLHDLVPGSSLHVVPDAGHLIHYDAPVAPMNEIRAWLDKA
jgi:pimeloyl-ACP methyl ester carboxylesterase